MFLRKNFSHFTYLEPGFLLQDIKDSFEYFLNEGLKEAFQEYFPIFDYSEKELKLDFVDYEFGEPKFTEEEAKYYGINYSAPLRVTLKLTNLVTKEETKQKIYFGELPILTKNYSFIINGIERTIVNQLLRSPGIYFDFILYGESKKFGAKVLPQQGVWLEFQTEPVNVLSVRIDRRKKVLATVLLKAFGFESNEEILKTFEELKLNDEYNLIENTLKKDETTTQEEAILEIHRKLKPFEPNTYDNAIFYFESTFLNSSRYNLSKVGRYHLNRRIKRESNSLILEKEDLIKIIAEIINLNNNPFAEKDQVDALYNRRVRDLGELLQNQARIGLARLKKDVQVRMSMVDKTKTLMPSQIVYARKFTNSIIEFFNISQLSQILDQTNPLSEVEHKRKLTVSGPGGLTKERATLEARDVHPTHYGRICPVHTAAEGQSVGVNLNKALYTRRNRYGFLETPYLKVENGKATNEIVWLTADQEKDYIISSRFVRLDSEGNILDEEVEARVKGEPRLISRNEINLIDLSPFQIFSLSTSLIPFVDHDDANRAQMGTNMQKQAVPLVNPDIPLVSTGLEEKVARESGLVLIAEEDGVVEEIDADHITLRIKTKKGSTKKVYYLKKFQRTSKFTCYNQKPIVKVGQKVKKGDILTDGPAIKNGTLALGKNLLVGFLSWYGYNYEDAIIISERLLKEDIFSSIYMEEFSIDVLDTKLGSEIVTNDIPGVPEPKLRNLTIDGFVKIGTYVKPGDILVGKITPAKEVELTPEENLLRAIFGEKAETKKDSSLYLEQGKEGRVIRIKVLDRAKGEISEPGVLQRIFVEIAKLRKIQVGDKLANRHGNKGVISLIAREEDMPFLPDGRRLDIILNPLGVISRMNLGQLLETHLGWAANVLGYRVIVPPFSGVTPEEIKEELRKAGLPEDGKTILYDGKTGEPFHQKVVVGYMTIMKLIHMVEDKIHARSIGPYSLITQQPLGGRARAGGQRLGEMELWALEAHGVTEVLHEMLTIKSDDIRGRNLTYEKIIKGEEIEITSSPAIFKVLISELKGLGFNVEFQFRSDEEISTPEKISQPQEIKEEQKIEK
jgi:DNA-directed RNA polymerase subunit beta